MTVFVSAGLLTTSAGAVTATEAQTAAGPLWVAHRGGDIICPENTVKGFNCGLANGADVLELDVRLTDNNRLAVLHDRRLNRATDCTGYILSWLSTDFLDCKVDVACLLECSEPTPTVMFQRVIRLFADRTRLFVEPMSREAAKRAMNRLDAEDAKSSAIIFTANFATAKDAIKRGYRVVAKRPFSLTPREMAAKGFWARAISRNSPDDRVTRIHRAGMRVFVNRIRNETHVAGAPKRVDGYITGDPRLGQS